MLTMVLKNGFLEIKLNKINIIYVKRLLKSFKFFLFRKINNTKDINHEDS